MKVSEEVKGRIAGSIFISIVAISITSLIFILILLSVTAWIGVQKHIGECILASAIVSLGWFINLKDER